LIEEAAFTNMDRRVKERLVGAAILVAIIVLIAPELLSGRKPDKTPVPAAVRAPVRSYTVDLADSSAAAHPVETSSVATTSAATPGSATPAAPMSGPATPAPATPGVPAAGASAGVAAAGAAVSGAVASASFGSSAPSTDGEAPSRPAEPTQVRRPAAPVRTAGQNGWWVQLGSFASQTNARRLVHELQTKGFPVYLQSSGAGKAMRHRVRVGPLADREAAMQTAAKLKAQGHPASVVPPAV
jgi:DedD protein